MLKMMHHVKRDIFESKAANGICARTLTLTNLRLAHTDPTLASKLWEISCQGGRVESVRELSSLRAVDEDQFNLFDAQGSIMLPSLCHAHIHLDKCFILDQCSDLITGNFEEALKVTGDAKATFSANREDLYLRGERLIRESIEAGVTSMRAHVEVDSLVGFACLNVALTLRYTYRSVCHIQISVFAQEPLFTASGDTEPGRNYDLLKEAAQRDGVSCVGSAPYVEPSTEQAKLNIKLILDIAGRWGYHADFHLDYNLDPTSEPLTYEVISQARKHSRHWTPTVGVPKAGITISHATRLQLFTPAQWHDLVDAIDGLPITFVGLPQSDMYMQGRSDRDKLLGPPRSTLRVPYIAEKYGLQVAMAVNNIENAFTPQGSSDPLSLCPLAVGLFQAATPKAIRTLARSVTLTAKHAIGIESQRGLFPMRGDPADFVIVHGNENLRSVVLNPGYDRTTVLGGVVVSRRRAQRWMAAIDRQMTEIALPWHRRVKWRYLLCPPWFAYKWAKSQHMVPNRVVPVHTRSDADAETVYMPTHLIGPVGAGPKLPRSSELK
ncbi:hypothetical protein BD779DRAFT_1668671 [Infundibulicybe gibba]|nr:hypothetical protein BD779DRAFT_1668671 [Infundibulicybe gibba]